MKRRLYDQILLLPENEKKSAIICINSKILLKDILDIHDETQIIPARQLNNIFPFIFIAYLINMYRRYFSSLVSL